MRKIRPVVKSLSFNPELEYNVKTDRLDFMFEGIAIEWGNGFSDMIVGQSQSGAHSAGIDKLSPSGDGTYSCSGYDSLENFIMDHAHKLCNGAYIIDSRKLTWEQACNCISGPMDKCKLSELTIEGWTNTKTIESLDNLPEIHGFDYVSLDIYARFWQNIGSKVGRYINGKVEWR